MFVTQTTLPVIKSDSVFKMKYSFRVFLKVISFSKVEEDLQEAYKTLHVALQAAKCQL